MFRPLFSVLGGQCFYLKKSARMKMMGRKHAVQTAITFIFPPKTYEDTAVTASGSVEKGAKKLIITVF